MAKSGTHQAVPLYSFTQRVVIVCFEQQAIRHVLDEVQVLQSGDDFVPLFWGRAPLVGRAFEVIFNVHRDDPRKKIVHHHYANVLAPRLHTIQSIELGQKGSLVLVYVLEERGDKAKILHVLFNYFVKTPTHKVLCSNGNSIFYKETNEC